MSPFARRTLLGLTGTGATAAVLTACAPQSDPSRPVERSERRSPTGTEPAADRPAGTAESSSPLVIVFSRAGENYWEGGRRDLEIGNTARLASLMADRLDCPLHQIEAAEPYPQGYDATVERNSREQDRDARPAIAGGLPEVAAHDTILLGSPVWGSRAPMIMSTLIERLDLRGKLLLPFVTYAVSGMAGIDEDYRSALPGTEVAEGLAVRGEEVGEAAPAVQEWLERNGLLG